MKLWVGAALKQTMLLYLPVTCYLTSDTTWLSHVPSRQVSYTQIAHDNDIRQVSLPSVTVVI